MKRCKEFKAEVLTLRDERKCLPMKSSPCQKRKTFYSKYKCRKTLDLITDSKKINFLLLYPTKQIADNFNQDKMQILKIRK